MLIAARIAATLAIIPALLLECMGWFGMSMAHAGPEYEGQILGTHDGNIMMLALLSLACSAAAWIFRHKIATPALAIAAVASCAMSGRLFYTPLLAAGVL
ncbi:MAG: hypothetical protein IPN84_00560 [Sphingomonadales bacterium]|jgi:hypothetical protein|nr:hypothetical protein [Sphingomonadales bacterium]